MLGFKNRKKKLKKASNVLNALLLKYQTDVYKLKQRIKTYKAIYNILYFICIQKKINIDTSKTVSILPDKAGLSSLRKSILQQNGDYLIGQSFKEEYVSLGNSCNIRTFHKLYQLTHGFEFTNFSITPDITEYNHIESADEDIKFYYFKYKYLLYVSLFKYDEYVKRVNNYNTSIDNCNEILVHLNSVLKKEYNKTQLNEILLHTIVEDLS